MTNDAAALVQKFWNFCNVLRDDGVSYGDYVEQLTYLLFLKMAEEQKLAFPQRPALIPPGLDWESLKALDGDALETHYRHILTTLGKGEGLLGLIFRKSQNKMHDPAKLKRLVSLIDQEMWSALNADVKSDLYEGLLEKNAQHVKTLLKIHGRAAVVVPDNVLFEGGAGETIRRKLLAAYDVHTLLRLPTGIFYSQGVKANVFFVTASPPAKSPGRTSSGFTTFAPMCTLP